MTVVALSGIAPYDHPVLTADDFPTVAELAAALRTSERNVRRAIGNGDIPSVRISERVVRVPLAEFIGKSAGGGAALDFPVPLIPAPTAHDRESN